MAVRRSARLRSQTSEEPEPQTETARDNNNNNNNNNSSSNENNDNNDGDNINKLPPVMERDEPASNTENAPTTTVQTPVHTPVRTPVRKTSKEPTESKTPTSVAAARPTMGEMHPSKVHQSTTKKADSGMLLGFNPVKKDANGNVVKDSVQNTPTKARASSPSSQYGTPGFEFKFASQESQLSDEAKRLMENMRGEVARIKTQLVQENGNNQQASDAAHDADRRIARPKGKTSRFSDAHMAQFKKMDSIAGHPSAFRATPGRFQPVTATGNTLKRTKSKAHLDDPESQNNSPSKVATAIKPSPAPVVAGAKRVKHNTTDDASTRRPASQEASDAPPVTPKRVVNPRTRPTVRSSLMTPTRASVARTTSASVKPAKKPSMIPAPPQSPAAKPTMAPPRTPRTDFNPRLKSSLPSFANLKSILRRREPLFSKDPSKIASGTHSAAPDFTPELLFRHSHDDKEDEAQTPSPKKHVYFSPSAKSPNEHPPASPSPSKIPTFGPSTRLGSDITYPTLPALTPEKDSAAKCKAATIRQVRSSDAKETPPLFPEVPGVMHGINNKKRHRVEPDDEKDTENVPPPDSNAADERSAKRVKANTPVKAPPAVTPSKIRSNTPSWSGSGAGRMGTPASVRKSRNFLTNSRLNMLAQPKHR